MGIPQTISPASRGSDRRGRSAWIEQFGRIEQILAHPEKIHNLKIREAILANADQARLSRELARIRTDAPFAFDLESCRRREPDRELLISLFREFEFSSLLQELKARGERPSETTASSGRRRNWRRSLPDWARSGNSLSNRSSLRRRRCAPPPSVWPFHPARRGILSPDHPRSRRSAAFPRDGSQGLGPFLSDPGVRKHGHDLKTALIVLPNTVFPSGDLAATPWWLPTSSTGKAQL